METQSQAKIYQSVLHASKQPPISDIDEEKVLAMIEHVAGLLGLKLPSLQAQGAVLDFISSYLSEYSIDEIKLAFVLAMRGQIQCDLKKMGQISAQDFQNIIAPYRIYRNLILQPSDMEEEVESEIPDIDGIYKESLKRIVKLYNEKNGLEGLAFEGNWDGKYNWMEMNGYFYTLKINVKEVRERAEQNIILSLKRRQAAKEAKDPYMPTNAERKLKDIFSGRKFAGQDKDEDYEFKKLMVIEWIKRLARGEVSIT